jgi:hypothetical protein
MTRPDNDHYFSRVGAVVFPVEGDQVTDEQLYSVCDPLRDRLLKFFAAVISKELGQATDGTVAPTSVWAAARTGTRWANTPPVADTIYTQPTPGMLLSSEYKFPLLAVYREGNDPHDKFTLEIERMNDRWGVEYIIGPLDPADHRRLTAAVHYARMAIVLALRKQRHPAYEGGADQMPEQELWRIHITGGVIAPATFGEQGKGQEFYGMRIDMKSEELVVLDTAKYPAHEGTDLNVGLGGPEGILADVMQASSDVPMPPTLG